MAHNLVTLSEVAACSAAEIVTSRKENSLITQSHNLILFSAALVLCCLKHRIYVWIHLPDIILQCKNRYE